MRIALYVLLSNEWNQNSKGKLWKKISNVTKIKIDLISVYLFISWKQKNRTENKLQFFME